MGVMLLVLVGAAGAVLMGYGAAEWVNERFGPFDGGPWGHA